VFFECATIVEIKKEKKKTTTTHYADGGRPSTLGIMDVARYITRYTRYGY